MWIPDPRPAAEREVQGGKKMNLRAATPVENTDVCHPSSGPVPFFFLTRHTKLLSLRPRNENRGRVKVVAFLYNTFRLLFFFLLLIRLPLLLLLLLLLRLPGQAGHLVRGALVIFGLAPLALLCEIALR